MLRCSSLAVAALCAAVTASAQSSVPGDWHLIVGQGGVSLALPEFSADPAAADVARTVWQTFFDDIAFSSWFRIVDPAKYRLAGATEPFDYHAWEGIGADVALTGRVRTEGRSLVANVVMYELKGQKWAWDSEFTSPTGAPRELAHYIADSVLAKLGIDGIARTRLAFSRTLDDGTRSLFQMDYDGHGQRPMTRDRFWDFQPRFGADESQLSFISQPTRRHSRVLKILNGPVIFDGPGTIFSAEWSPDGTRLAFSSSRDEPGNAEIYVMRRDGTRIRRLTHQPGIDVSPTWSPTGREIAFTSERAGSPQIYIMDAEGLNVRRVSMKGSYNAEPSWSPSTIDSEIAYASRVQGGRFDIVVHELSKNQVRFLTSNHGLNESPRWSPDGQHLVFTSDRTGEPQIYSMHRDGSSPKQLTFEGKNQTPAWGPYPTPRLTTPRPTPSQDHAIR